MTDPAPQPAYLRWRGDNRIAFTLVAASVSLVTDALAAVFGLHATRGSLLYITALLAAAVTGGLIMTHNRAALAISKPLVLLCAGTALALRAAGLLVGTASLVCAAIGALFALAYSLAAQGPHWNAFMQDVRTGEDTPRAAIRNLQKDP